MMPDSWTITKIKINHDIFIITWNSKPFYMISKTFVSALGFFNAIKIYFKIMLVSISNFSMALGTVCNEDKQSALRLQKSGHGSV